MGSERAGTSGKRVSKQILIEDLRRMAADLFEPRQDRRGSILDTRETTVAAPGFDPSLDPTIRRLFEQQAEIQAKLAALLPTRYVPTGRLELDMLRHKLRALEIYASSQSMSPPFILFYYYYLPSYTDRCVIRSLVSFVVLTRVIPPRLIWQRSDSL